MKFSSADRGALKPPRTYDVFLIAMLTGVAPFVVYGVLCAAHLA